MQTERHIRIAMDLDMGSATPALRLLQRLLLHRAEVELLRQGGVVRGELLLEPWQRCVGRYGQRKLAGDPWPNERNVTIMR